MFIHLVWITVFVQIVGFDLKHRLILNRVTYPAIVIALALSFVSPGLTIWSSLAGCVAVGLFFVIQNLVSRGSIGLGDAKLGALIGAICGISLDYNHIGAVYAVIYAVFLGGGLTAYGVLDKCWEALPPGGRLVAHAVTVESEALLHQRRRAAGGRLVKLALSYADPLGGFTTWRPALPVTQWQVTKP